MILYVNNILNYILGPHILVLVMDQTKKYTHVIDFINDLHAEGRYSFTKEEITGVFKGDLKQGLNRQVNKKRILWIRRGFYIIIPNEYIHSGILPPPVFIDDLMKFIGKPYYVALSSAAALYGSSHQQLQAFHVMIPGPERNINVGGVKVRFFVKKDFKSGEKIRHKTDTGYIRISIPELTALDLVAYESRIGGINRIITILNELEAQIRPEQLLREASEYRSIIIAQRLGYLLDLVNKSETTELLAGWIAAENPPYSVLKPGGNYNDCQRDSRWKIIANVDIECDI